MSIYTLACDEQYVTDDILKQYAIAYEYDIDPDLAQFITLYNEKDNIYFGANTRRIIFDFEDADKYGKYAKLLLCSKNLLYHEPDLKRGSIFFIVGYFKYKVKSDNQNK